MQRFKVFSIRSTNGTSDPTYAGSAITNRDGSINVHLQTLPLDGQLLLKPEPVPMKTGMEIVMEARAKAEVKP